MDEYIGRADFMNRITSANAQADFSRMTGREAYEKIVGMLNNHPAADVSKVRRGKWINEPPYKSVGGDWLKAQECSVCGSFYVSDGNKPYSNHKYCAECGAQMDVGGDHETD